MDVFNQLPRRRLSPNVVTCGAALDSLSSAGESMSQQDVLGEQWESWGNSSCKDPSTSIIFYIHVNLRQEYVIDSQWKKIMEQQHGIEQIEQNR